MQCPKHDPGAYDREVFLVLKELGPSLSCGGDMAMDFLAGVPIKELQEIGRRADAAAQLKSKGFEVGYDRFAINGKMLGFGDPVRVTAGEIRSLECWAGIRNSHWILLPTIRVLPCSTAISNCIWISDSWRCLTMRKAASAASKIFRSRAAVATGKLKLCPSAARARIGKRVLLLEDGIDEVSSLRKTRR